MTTSIPALLRPLAVLLSALLIATAMPTAADATASNGAVLLTPSPGIDLHRLAEATGGTALPASGLVHVPADRAGMTWAASPMIAESRTDLRVEIAVGEIIGGDYEPDDPYWKDAWALQAAGLDTAFAAADAGDLDEVLVAVIDTGVAQDHPDLQGRLAAPITVIGTPETDAGFHGTTVAGIIAANRDNGIDVVGACSNCTVLPVKVFDDTDGVYTTSGLTAEGIRQAADAGADIINASIVVSANLASDDIADAVTYAQDAGAIVVASAGNDSGTKPNYPANQDGVVSVAAADQRSDRFDFSSHGAWVDFAAGGCSPALQPGDDPIVIGCGTSFAAALAAAAIATLMGTGMSGGESVEALENKARAADFVNHGHIDVSSFFPAPDPEPTDPPVTVLPEEPEPLEPVLDPDTVDILPYEDTQILGAGESPVDLARSVARATIPVGGGDRVLVANARTFADSLSGSSFAMSGPVLLTDHVDTTEGTGPADTELVEEVARMLGEGDRSTCAVPADPDVILLGGPVAVGSATEAALTDAGYCVVRHAGPTRTQTAIQIAEDVLASTAGDTVILARGFAPAENPGAAWADAASVGAYAACTSTPILLANEFVAPEVDDALVWITANPHVRTVIIVGGTAAVSAGHEQYLRDLPAGLDVTRVEGASREDTSGAIARDLWGDTSGGVIVVDGRDANGWAAALTASHPAAMSDAPVIYINPLAEVQPNQQLLDAADWQWRIG